MRWAGVAVLVLGGTVGACRAPAPEAKDLDAAIDAARAVQRDHGPRAALPLLERALADARAQHSRRHEGVVLGHLGTAHKNLADYTRAMELHSQALAIKNELGDEVEQAKTLNNIGLVEEARGNCAKALAVYKQSLEIFTRLDQPRFAASVLNNEALCHDTLGQFDRSMANYERALALHRAEGNEVGESETLGNIGGVYLLLGRYRDAAERYQASLAISTRLDARQSMVLDLINLGSARTGIGAFPAAHADLERARRLAHDAGLAREEADAARALARLAEVGGRYDEARRALSEAIAIYERAGLVREQVDAAHVLGELDLATGDLGAAAAQFARASETAARLDYFTGRLASLLALGELEVRRRNLDVASRHAATALAEARAHHDVASAAAAGLLAARIHLAASRPDSAVTAATEAFDAAREAAGALIEADARLVLGDAARAGGHADQAVSHYDAASHLTGAGDVPDLVWRLRFGRGRAYETLGRAEDALREYLAAVETIEQTRHHLGSDRARTGYLDDKREVYGALVRLLLRLKRPAEAFQVAERLRAEGYLELVTRSAALSGAGAGAVPADLLARIRHLQSSIEHELRQSAADQRGGVLLAYRDELRSVEAEWARVVTTLTAAAPLGRALAALPVPSASAVQRRLSPSDALVQFVVDADETVVFVLRRDELHAEILPLGARVLRTRIELLRGLLANTDTTEWQAPAERLDLELLGPLRRRGWLDRATRLYVVPHAELNYLPFAVLRRHADRGPRLLVEDVSLVVLPAATALLRSGPARVAPGALFALAPERPRLPFARREVEALGHLFPVGRREVLVGAEATEARFKREVGQFRIVHLATHGFFNRVNPLFSGVDLEAAGDEDGRLQVFEILGLSLAADLVTLSACDTALGAGELTDLPAGEELVGLTRAFLSAGSRHVLATLWEINDRATAPLMEEFYRAARRRAPAEALAAVMRRHLAVGGREAHPYFWAPKSARAPGAKFLPVTFTIRPTVSCSPLAGSAAVTETGGCAATLKTDSAQQVRAAADRRALRRRQEGMDAPETSYGPVEGFSADSPVAAPTRTNFKSSTADPAGITVRSTRYVSATQVEATIDIAAGAALSLFDIRVTNSNGRSGKGSDLFRVVEKAARAACTTEALPVNVALVATLNTLVSGSPAYGPNLGVSAAMAPATLTFADSSTRTVLLAAVGTPQSIAKLEIFVLDAVTGLSLDSTPLCAGCSPQTHVQLAVPNAGGTGHMSSGDVNADGIPDFAVLERNSTKAAVFIGELLPSGRLVYSPVILPPPPANYCCSDIAVGDLDGVAGDEIALSNLGGGSGKSAIGGRIHLNKSSASAATNYQTIIPSVTPAIKSADSYGAGLAIGEVTGDGVPDLVVGAPLRDVGGVSDAGAVFVHPRSGSSASVHSGRHAISSRAGFPHR